MKIPEGSKIFKTVQKATKIVSRHDVTLRAYELKAVDKAGKVYGKPIYVGQKDHLDKYRSELAKKHKIALAEDAATNCAGNGNVAGIGVGPNGDPPKKKSLKTILQRRKGPNDDVGGKQ